MKQFDREIMMWHSAGKSPTWIAEEFGVEKQYIRKLIAKDGF